MSILINKSSKLISSNIGLNTVKVGLSLQQERFKYYQVPFHGAKNYWPQWSMMKDQKRRMTLKEYGPYKLRYNAIRKAELLPPELREVADHEIATVPKDAGMLRIKARCSVTSRGRGNVLRFRLSRFIFRHLADYNKLAGVQRGFWS